MIARVARFTFPGSQHREEAERNGSGRVGPALAQQPGFEAIYFGRTAELEAVSISMFDSRESADAAGTTMNARPLLPGQVPEMLPTPGAVWFYRVVSSFARNQVPTIGRLGYLTLTGGTDERAADHWAAEAFTPMLERVPGLCQGYLLHALEGDERIALTFWESPDAMAAGGASIGAWQEREAQAGRQPAFVGGEALMLRDLRLAIAAVPATMPAAV